MMAQFRHVALMESHSPNGIAKKRRANGRVFRKVLSPFASGFRILNALIDVSFSYARSNPHQMFIRIK